MKRPATIRMIALLGLLCSSLLSFGRTGDEIARAALDALLVQSDLNGADSLASQALRRDSKNVSALFVRMEVAHLRLDDEVVIKSALKICELAPDDPRAEVAAGRLRELAGNYDRFVAAVPAIKRAIQEGGRVSDPLKLVLVAAAANDTPEFDLLQQSRDYGLLTDWRLQGPFGTQGSADFDKPWGPEKSKRRLRGGIADMYQFADGAVTLNEKANTAGVYYADGEFEVPSSGTWRLRLQTLGTLDVFVDGKNVVRRDARSSALPEVTWQSIRLEEGKHKILVKFLPSASPFRIAVLPPSPGPKKRRSPSAIHAGPESDYVPAALQYFEGNYDAVITSVEQKRKNLPAPILVLLADSWSKVEEDPPEAWAAYARALQVSPDCTRSSLRIAELELQNNSAGSFRDSGALAQAEQKSVRAVEALARLAWRTDDLEHAAHFFEVAAKKSPSVANLKDAMLVASAMGDHVRANALATRLASTVAGAMALASVRREQGRHAEAANALKAWKEAAPLNRTLWSAYAENLLLAGQYDEAQAAAEHLIGLSPDDSSYRQILKQAVDRTPFQDNAPDTWYANYRRNAEEIIRETSRNSSSGVVQLLNDRAWYVRDDNMIDEYVHTVTKLTTRGAIIQNAELSLPANAEILSLRTIEPDGRMVEPELMAEKASISMPGLTPGASIEVEYTMRRNLQAFGPRMEFLFGSTNYPVEYSRLVVVADAQGDVKFVNGPEVPRAAETTAGKLRIFAWERNGIGVLRRESAAPDAATYYPSISLQLPGAEERSRQRLAEALQTASRIGPRIRLQAAQLRQSDDLNTARNIYDYVRRYVTSNDSRLEETPSAERTLALHRGNRTATLIALARAAGLQADLVLAADYDQPREYRYPLIRMRANEREWVVDAEADELPFAALKPTVFRREAAVLTSSGALSQISLPSPGAEERSLAQGEIRIASDGTTEARIQIALGLTRGNELRRNLRTMSASARLHFLEDVATRIMPGVVAVKGEIRNEAGSGPVTIYVECRTGNLVGNFVRANQPRRIQQLVPGLGLKNMYASTSSRTLPIAIDSVLFESTKFTVIVPQGMELSLQNADLNVTSAFGNYMSRGRKLGRDTYEFTREFNVPMQVVPVPQYGAFKSFADQIDAAEKSQLQVSYGPRRS